MRLVTGGSLAGRVRAGIGDAEAVAALVATLARAMHYAHERGVVHRDLKPANVLLDTDGTPFITDFGLAKRSDRQDGVTKTGAILGTPAYMAPEQARGERHVGPAADVYALGAILYELLTGKPPFHGPTPLDVILDVLERDPVDPRTVNPAANADLGLIALKCLAKDPTKRYMSAAELAADLDRWRAGEPITARRPGWARRVLGWARREPGLACRLVMLGLCALVVEVTYDLQSAANPVKHLLIIGLLAVWAGVAVVCQWLLRRTPRANRVVALWLTADAACLSGLLTLDESHETPLVLVYGLFVAASGVWLRVRLVWLSTLAAVAGYAALVGGAAARGAMTEAPHHHLIAIFTLVATGAVVAYQVRRTKQLSRLSAPPIG
jgi:serine/threonine-protein kinase